MNDQTRQSRIERVLTYAEENGMQIETGEYCEPGYDEGKMVAFANWNNVTRWDEKNREWITVDDTPQRVGNLLEKLDVELDWQDCYQRCEDCYKYFRTTGDCHGWRMHGHIGDGWCQCADCIAEDPAHVLEELEGNPRKALTYDIDMEDQGYVNLCWDESGCIDSWENGLYGGQDADPYKVSEDLDARDASRHIFQIDSTGQFDVDFSVWVHRECLGIAEDAEWPEVYSAIQSFLAKPIDCKADIDPAIAMRNALSDASAKMGALKGDGVRYAECHADGTASVKLVSPQDFIEGNV